MRTMLETMRLVMEDSRSPWEWAANALTCAFLGTVLLMFLLCRVPFSEIDPKEIDW